MKSNSHTASDFESSASGDCTDETLEYEANDEGLLTCSISATCHDRSVSSQTVMLEDVDDLNACRTGTVLTTNACSDYDCGDHYCSIADCQSNWYRSDASDTCSLWSTDLQYSGTQAQCVLTVQCGVNTYAVTEAMSDVDDLVACGPNGSLAVGSC